MESYESWFLLQECCKVLLQKLEDKNKRLAEFDDLLKYLDKIVNKLCNVMSAVCQSKSALYFVKRLIDLLAEQCFGKEKLAKQGERF